ncbi:hypothetical protein QFZ76_000613 [Streptomyces sp. V4I2]|nr:hypothetical protein [Streptomyces sp. V4I2]
MLHPRHRLGQRHRQLPRERGDLRPERVGLPEDLRDGGRPRRRGAAADRHGRRTGQPVLARLSAWSRSGARPAVHAVQLRRRDARGRVAAAPSGGVRPGLSHRSPGRPARAGRRHHPRAPPGRRDRGRTEPAEHDHHVRSVPRAPRGVHGRRGPDERGGPRRARHARRRRAMGAAHRTVGRRARRRAPAAAHPCGVGGHRRIACRPQPHLPAGRVGRAEHVHGEGPGRDPEHGHDGGSPGVPRAHRLLARRTSDRRRGAPRRRHDPAARHRAGRHELRVRDLSHQRPQRHRVQQPQLRHPRREAGTGRGGHREDAGERGGRTRIRRVPRAPGLHGPRGRPVLLQRPRLPALRREDQGRCGPNGILSPGRHGVWPSAHRTGPSTDLTTNGEARP